MLLKDEIGEEFNVRMLIHADRSGSLSVIYKILGKMKDEEFSNLKEASSLLRKNLGLHVAKQFLAINNVSKTGPYKALWNLDENQ